VSGEAAAGATTVEGFFHVGLCVADVDASLALYRDVLGLETVSDTVRRGEELQGVRTLVGVDPESVRIVLLAVPGTERVFLELFAYEGAEQHSATARPWDIAAGHMAFYVADADAVHAAALAIGCGARSPVSEVKSGPHRGAKAVYLIDPDGYHVEVYQPAPGRS
jgi:catechol 2,3-dioxygenase-like lactoylglutathione lyase family enzyme